MNRVKVDFASDVGLKRKDNQDNLYVAGIVNTGSRQSIRGSFYIEEEQFICGVFDGMGGESNGGEASLIAATMLGNYYDSLIDSICDEKDFDECLENYCYETDVAIQSMLCENAIIKNCEIAEKVTGGTTGTIVVHRQRLLRIANIGDSRVYLIREGKIYQLTRDDTLAQDRIDAGAYTIEEARRKRDWHVLTKYLGAEGTFEHVIKYEIKTGDIYILCSDGVSDSLDVEKMYRKCIEAEWQSDKNIATELINSAMNHGSNDNVTAVVIHF